MIEVQHLTKRYGRVTAVDDVSFRVERGEILGFLGPNGAGKTTTMRILTGYMPATEGKAIVAGLRRLRPADRSQAAHRLSAGDAAALPRHDRRRIPDVRREDQRRPPAERQRAHQDDHGAHAHRRHGDRLCCEAVERLPAARRPRAGAHPQSRRPDSRRADRRASTRSRSSRRASSSRSSPATTRSFSARTSFPKSRRPASASSSSTRAASSRSTRPTT